MYAIATIGAIVGYIAYCQFAYNLPTNYDYAVEVGITVTVASLVFVWLCATGFYNFRDTVVYTFAILSLIWLPHVVRIILI